MHHCDLLHFLGLRFIRSQRSRFTVTLAITAGLKKMYVVSAEALLEMSMNY